MPRGDLPSSPAFDPAPPGAPPQSLEAIEQELHALTAEHARLRSELEDRYHQVRSIEDRFLSLRPDADLAMQRELKRRMVLSRNWREELDQAYQSLLTTAHMIGAVTRKIHELQLRAAQIASMPGGPRYSSPAFSPDRR